MWTDRLLLTLFDRFPPRESIFKEAASRARDEYAREDAQPFHELFATDPAEMYRGRDVLDLGSGFGGTAVRLRERGARRVVGLEVEKDKVERAQEFAREQGVEAVSFVQGFGEDLPLDNATFDLVVMHDVLEHVHDPRAVLAECRRVLRPGGSLANVFPPYYHLRGGSHLHGYATSLPGLNLVFTTRQLRSATQALFERDGIPYRDYLRELDTDKLWNMNGLTVRGFRQIVADQGWRVIQWRQVGYLGAPSQDRRRRALQQVAERLARLPVVEEPFCARVCALLSNPV